MKNFILKRIDNKSDLIKSLVFLEKRFNWSVSRRKETYKMLISQNQKHIIFGYLLKNRSNQIVGVLLTVLQGQIILNFEKTNVINIFSWFIEEKYRGLGGLEMCILLNKDFKNCSITNYTPSNDVSKILKVFGFKKIYYQLIKVNIFEFIFKNYGSCSINDKELFLKNNYKCFHPNNLYLYNIKLSHQFIINKKKILVEGIKTNTIKTIFKIPLVVPVFQIFNLSDSNISYKDLKVLCRKILIKYFVFSVNLSISKSDMIDFPKFENKDKISFLIKTPYENISFIPIEGSELSLVTNSNDLLLPIWAKFKKIMKKFLH